MASIQVKIRDAAPRNAQLLKLLSETDYAFSALEQNASYIHDLEQEIGVERKNLEKASKTVANEYAEHKKYRDSHMRRLAYKLGRKKEKFEEEASKEEKEWLDAVRIELHSKNKLEQLNAKLESAKTMRSELDDVAKHHTSTKQELDALYRSIFSGPTPEVPGEDEKERLANDAESHFRAIHLQLSTEKQAHSILTDADRFLSQARVDIEDALDAATADAWGVGGSFADMAKHTSLSKAQNNVSHVQMLMQQARRVQPLIQGIGNMDVPEMRFMTDVVFDNIFSDLNAKDRIRDSQALLARAKTRLIGELRAEAQRIEGLTAELNQASVALNGRREELQKFRSEAFHAIANGAEVGVGVQDHPPGYEESPPYQA